MPHEILAQPPKTPVQVSPAPSTVSHVIEPLVQKTPEAPPAEPANIPKPDDIMKRIAENKASQPPAKTEVPEELKITLDDIKDPAMRQVLEEKKLNLEKYYNKRYMELAEKIKQTEAERQGLNTWTPEKVDKLVQDQNFIQAAQQRLQQQATLQAPAGYQGSPEEWSALSESEKKAIYGGISQVEAKVNGLLAQQEQLLRLQDDERIRQRIPDYNPLEVDQFTQDIQRGRISTIQLRELIWKAINHDKNVEQSYRFGFQDRQGDIRDKQVASTSSIGSASTQLSDEPPKRAENENSQTWFSRLAKYRLDQSKKATVKR